MIKAVRQNPLLEAPAYSLADAASYTRVPYQTVRYWATGRNRVPPLINLPISEPPALSYLNLLECHILNALRTTYSLQINSVRRALNTLARIHSGAISKHPLLEMKFSTDGVDLFLNTTAALVNLSQGGQTAIREILEVYLQRIEWPKTGVPKFYPFVVKHEANEPKIISIVATIAFGRSVIDGTGIATAVIASRFNARESVPALAEEYGRSPEEIEEAIRWEAKRTAAAA